MTLSRREMMAGAAGGVVAVGASSLAGAAPARTGSDYDVIVIGGGFAGLVAARDCAERGAKVLLLEARDRVGGRTHDVDFRGSHIEQGGTWIHWAQGYVWAEFRRYGLTIKESPQASNTEGSWISQGKLSKGSLLPILEELQHGLNEVANIDGASGARIFPLPYQNFRERALVAKYDGMSLADRMAQIQFSPRVRDIVDSNLQIGCGAPLSEGSFLDWVKWWQLNDHSLRAFNDRQARYKIAEGTGALARAILTDAPMDHRLSTPVASVTHTSTGAVVTDASGRQYRGKSVICTVPMNVLASIRFDPPLNPVKIKASQQGGSPRSQKRYLLLKEKIGLWNGFAPSSEPINAAFTEEERPDGTLICLFAPGRFDLSDKAQAQAAIRTLLPGVQVVDTAGHDWRVDPYSRGLWSWYRPGQLTTAFDELRRPEGVIHFASADSANGWRGFIDGAMESGSETAVKVLDILSK